MSIISRAADTYYTYRFLKILTTDWEDMDAYELGIIDSDGKVLKKSRELRTREEKSAYTLFHRLVFALKRMLEKFPGGRTVVARYNAALFLLREHTGMSEDQISKVLDMIGLDIDDMQLTESVSEQPWYVQETGELSPGKYQLVNEILSPVTGEIIGTRKSCVIVDEKSHPVDTILGSNIYEVRHVETKQTIYVTARDIQR